MSRSRFEHIKNHVRALAECDDKAKRQNIRFVINRTLDNYKRAKETQLQELEAESHELQEALENSNRVLSNTMDRLKNDPAIIDTIWEDPSAIVGPTLWEACDIQIDTNKKALPQKGVK